jgi:hypothetical protein
MTAAPVGLYNAAFGAACRTCTLEHSVMSILESAIFGWFPTLVFERFHGADSIGVALRGDLCGFHMVSKGVNCPRNLRSRPHRLAGKFTRSLR